MRGDEGARAGQETPGRPAVVWPVYFGTWEGKGSRASRRRLSLPAPTGATPRSLPRHRPRAFAPPAHGDDRREDVEVLVRLSPGELDGAQHAGRSRGVDADVAVDLVGRAVGHEHEAAGSAAAALATDFSAQAEELGTPRSGP